MLKIVRSVASLLLSYGLLLFANGLFGTLLGVRTQIEGFSTEVVGVIMAGYFLGLLLGALHAVRIVAGVGHIRAFAAFASLTSISALAHVLWIDPIAWFMMRLMSGFCMAGMVMVTESWLNERATRETRGRVLSLYMITNYFAAGSGQYLLPLADPGEFHLFSVASIIFSLALVPVLLTRAVAPLPVQHHPMNFRELYRTAPLGLVGAFCAGIVNATFYGMGPVFAHGIGLSITATSTFMASVILGGLVLQWPVGRLSDRVDRRRVLAGVAMATALACMGIVLTEGRTQAWLFTAGVIYGGLSFTIYSLSAAHANDFCTADKLVQTASGLLVAYGVGASGGPVLAATLMGQVGPQGLFIFNAIVVALLGLFGIHRIRRRAPRSIEEQSPYIALPGAQFASEELYTAVRDQMDKDLARMAGRF